MDDCVATKTKSKEAIGLSRAKTNTMAVNDTPYLEPDLWLKALTSVSRVPISSTLLTDDLYSPMVHDPYLSTLHRIHATT